MLVSMELTARFTNTYDGEEHVHDEILTLPTPTSVDFDEDLQEWSEDHLFPRTGDGNAIDQDAGYFVEILACAECPTLVGREFAWGI